MTTVSEIQNAVRALAEEEYQVFSSWFEQYDEERWDRQIERDQRSAPLRDLMDKARADFAAGKCTRL
jgi:hypothetical protein